MLLTVTLIPYCGWRYWTKKPQDLSTLMSKPSKGQSISISSRFSFQCKRENCEQMKNGFMERLFMDIFFFGLYFL
jgi:hypothetical protein